jgi:dihydroorotate dehydrogenase
VDGFVAANTSTERAGLVSPWAAEGGGLSGRPVHAAAVRAVGALYRLTGGRLPIVGVGGIFSPEDAYAFIRAGATLLQVYTGLVYRGPSLVRIVRRGLTRLLARDGFRDIAAAVGSAHT